MKKHLAYILVATSLLLILVACGSRQQNDDSEESTDLTLRVLSPIVYVNVLRDAMGRMARELAADGINFRIELTAYERGESYNQRLRLQTMLMAGHGYDLIVWDNHPIKLYASRGFLTDFYALIDSHPITSREDFFLNVLEAYEYRGGLYAFPLTFGFEYIGINSNAPESIVDRFMKHGSITIHELLELYSDKQQQYMNEFNHLQFIRGNSPAFGMIYYIAAMGIADFVDFDARVSNLYSPQFAGFLDVFYHAFNGRHLFEFSISHFSHPVNNVISEMSQSSTFVGLSSHLSPVLALFTHEDPHFLNFIPLATDDGRLIINPGLFHNGGGGVDGSTWAKLAIPASGDGHLAWEFIQHLIPVMLSPAHVGPDEHGFQSFGRNSLVTPITRRDFEPHIMSVLASLRGSSFDIVPLVGMADGGGHEQAINRLAELNEMPMSILEGFNLPDVILVDAFTPFLQGITSAEATAQEIHNRISLWLIE